MANYPAVAQDKPIFVFSSMHLNVTEGGKLVPEIAVNNDGTWRKATLDDVWIGQEFEFFDEVTKDPIIQGKVIVNSSIDDFFVRCNTKDNFKNDYTYWGIYKAKKQFSNFAKGKILKSKYIIDNTTRKTLFDKKKSVKMRLQNVVKKDWKNIQREFPKLHTSNISDFMIDDINGDKKNDYVLILSDLEHVKGAAEFIYISNGKKFNMIPIEYWEDASYSNGWPIPDFLMDINGDGIKEIGIDDVDGDITSLTIYGWIKERQAFMRLYTVDELWSGD
jgi:hypothetical protein